MCEDSHDHDGLEDKDRHELGVLHGCFYGLPQSSLTSVLWLCVKLCCSCCSPELVAPLFIGADLAPYLAICFACMHAIMSGMIKFETHGGTTAHICVPHDISAQGNYYTCRTNPRLTSIFLKYFDCGSVAFDRRNLRGQSFVLTLSCMVLEHLQQTPKKATR